MKKIFLFFVVLFSFGICFAGKIIHNGDVENDYEIEDGIEVDEDDDSDDIDFSHLVYTPQTTGWTVGCYFSFLETKPTFSFISDTFEVEFSCNIINFDFQSAFLGVGVGPGVSIGYNSNPFEKGIQNCVGVSYFWYPVVNSHFGSLYYRFGVRSRFGSAFISEVKLPIAAFLNGKEFVSIANTELWPIGFLCSIMTISVGYKFYF